MQTAIVIGRAHLGGVNSDWTCAYSDIVRNLCNASLVQKYTSLQRMAQEYGGSIVEKRLDIIREIAKERKIELD